MVSTDMNNSAASVAPVAAPSKRTRQALEGAGSWFDGQSSRKQAVHLLLLGDVLRVLPEQPSQVVNDAVDELAPALAMPRRYRLRDVQVSEPWGDAPTSLTLPDGGMVWVAADAPKLAQALFARAGQAAKPGWLGHGRALKIIQSWPGVVASLLATIAFVVWFDRQGAALAADAAMVVTPVSADNALGNAAWKIYRKEFEASTMPQERQDRVAQRFDAMAARLAPGRAVQLMFLRPKTDDGRPRTDEEDEAQATPQPPSRSRDRDEKREPVPELEGGFNAFALPNGHIVLLDGLANAMTDDELMVVLGHELGHVVHRHSMKQIVRGFGLLAVTSLVLGDASSLAATVVAGVQGMRFSREAERESDTFGRQAIASLNLPPDTEAKVWRKFQDVVRRATGDREGDVPSWMNTHPGTDERLKAAEAASGSRPAGAANPGTMNPAATNPNAVNPAAPR
jgi:Zn-dependent protease with chaperone function